MSLYIRKSLRAGPLRFNLSKSGIGVSAGFTGFRIGTGPRGNYVHMGRSGLYYRKTSPYGTKPKPEQAGAPEESLAPQPSGVEMKEIESVETLELQDSSSAELLAELNEKQKRFRLWPIIAALAVGTVIVLAVINVQAWVYAVVSPIAAIAIFWAYQNDQVKKTVILFYELEDGGESAYQALHDAFKEIAGCVRSWHIEASGSVTNIHEWKRQAGADTLVKRKPIQPALGAPPFVSTNISVPVIPAGRQSLYLFPDRLFVYESGKVGAVAYSDVQIELSNSRFIESESVPSDAKIVDHTWKYVNKKGGPDKRFKDNRQLPIALYTDIHFKSVTGLNELIEVSKSDMGISLRRAFEKLIAAQSASAKQSST